MLTPLIQQMCIEMRVNLKPHTPKPPYACDSNMTSVVEIRILVSPEGKERMSESRKKACQVPRYPDQRLDSPQAEYTRPPIMESGEG